jgi:hypothetical protein
MLARAVQRPVEVDGELSRRAVGGDRVGPDDYPRPGREVVQALAHEVAQAPAYPVAHHGTTDPATHDEPHLGLRRTGTRRHVHDDSGDGGASATPDGGGELGAGTHACRGRQHGPAGQAESRARPLRRRPARMARPARVRMRSRNPWVLARRRLFGWNVRLLTEQLPTQGPARLVAAPGDIERHADAARRR